ncbi:putative capsule polysaccharide biosynthesis [Desulfosarcina variabilis str. Montpellier]
MFYLVEEKMGGGIYGKDIPFKSIRVLAEKNARKKILDKNKKWEDITLDEIYDTLEKEFKIPAEISVLLKKIELDTDRKYLRPRKSGKELFDLVKKTGKKIFVITDVFYDQGYVEKILSENGFEGYERCFVSSQMRLTKQSGNIYKKIMSETGISANNWVHIGDNAISDVKKAEENGIGAIYIPKPSDLFMKNKNNRKIWNNKINQLEPSFRIILGLVINRFFDKPFDEKDKWSNSAFHGSPNLFGYYACGPFLLFMTKWLLEEASIRKYKKLHFVSRDGHLPLKIYNLIKKYYKDPVETNYLYMSRIIGHAALMEDDHDFLLTNEILPIEKDVPISIVLKERFFIENPETLESFLNGMGYQLDCPPLDYNEFLNDCMNHPDIRKVLLQRQKWIRELIKKYYRPQFYETGLHAIFDVGYTGKIQKALSLACEKAVDGFYFSSTFLGENNTNKNTRCYNYLGAPINDRINTIFNRGIIENIISDATAGSMIGMKMDKDHIAPVFTEPEKHQKTIDVQKKIQEGIMDFVNDVIENFGDDFVHFRVAPSTAFYTISQYMQNPEENDAKIFLDVKFENGSMGRGGYLVSKDRKMNGWKAGCDAAFEKKKSVVGIEKVVNKEKIKQAIQRLKQDENIKNILWIDYAMVPDKYDFISYLSESDDKINILILDAFQGDIKIDSPRISHLSPPDEIVNTEKYRYYVELSGDAQLQALVHTFAAHHQYLTLERKEISYEEALSSVTIAYNFTIDVINSYKPDVVFIWNEFYPLSKVAKYISDLLEYKSIYLEYGLLPGTLQADKLGQVGESWIARQFEKFNSLEIDDSDLEKAKKAIEYFKETGINRRKQPQYGNLLKKIDKKNKKLIFLAGHNNYSSGMFPYDHHAKRLHSPFLRDSNHLFETVLKIAEQNDWFVIYKPHPYSKKQIFKPENSKHYEIIDNENINECVDTCDVVVTVLSQVSYLGLIRNKPVVMLGYTPMVGKGCSYEAFKEESIEGAIKDALIGKNAKNMHDRWIEHAARLLKYSLFYYSKSNNDKFAARTSSEFIKMIDAYVMDDLDDFSMVKKSINP